jgi:amino acid adenylation domain-containing protein
MSNYVKQRTEIDDVTKRIAGLSREKRDLFALMLKKRGREFNSFPLSFAQKRLWFLDQLEPGNPSYNLHLAVRLKGHLDPATLEKTLNEIVRRHEALRSAFRLVNEEPIQIINAAGRVAIPVVDLRALPQKWKDSQARQITNEEAQYRFDLGKGPLFRTCLLHLEDQDHVVTVTMHHIVSDGWSMGVFVDEIATLYKAFLAGKPSSLTELTKQYVDFAVWQRERLNAEGLDALLSYWRQQIEGSPTLINLPTDHPRPAVQSFRGATRSIALSKPLSESIKSFSDRQEVTLFMTLLAAFSTLLYKYSGDEDIVIGTSVANRNLLEIERLIGFFINNLALRCDHSGNPTFREMLERVREVTIGAYAHQDLPFERLVEEINPERTLSHAPLFQVLFILQNAPVSALQLPGLKLEILGNESKNSKIDLALSVSETNAGLIATFEYSTDLFEAATISRMLDDFQSLLGDIVANPDLRLLMLSPFPGQHAEIQPEYLRDIENQSNLTKSQLLFWVGHKLNPEAPLYNLAHRFTIAGKIDVELFLRAFKTLVNSSDALRTVIRELDGVPRREIVSDFPHGLEYLDLSSDRQPDERVDALLAARCKGDFDISERLFDSVLMKVSEEKFIWYLNEHQINADAVSASLIFHLMSELYGRSLKGELPETLDLPPFQDYVDYERAYRSSPEFRRVESYWKQKLSDSFEPIAFYGNVPVKKTSVVERISIDLGAERTGRIKQLAAKEGVFVKTLNASVVNVFAAVIFTYLYRISGNRRLALGMPFHNRRSEAFRRTIGLFMEVLPLRVTLEDNETFLSLIQKVVADASEVLKHRQYAIGNPRNSKVYEVLLNYHTAEFSDFCGALLEEEWLHPGHGEESLTIQVRDFGLSGSLMLDFEFHCDVFGETQRGEAIEHLIQVLDTCLDDVCTPLGRVELLSEAERRRILSDFNQTDASLPIGLFYSELFEKQAKQAPDQLAVNFGELQLTYFELTAKASQLANHLRLLGVGSEVIVGLYLERSVDAMIGLLAILQAGGVYLPLDPAYPVERLAYMLEHSRASVLVTSERLAFGLPSNSARVVSLESALEDTARKGYATSDTCIVGKNLAYLIYTSGSTGTPKGAMVDHDGMLNHLYAKINDLKVNSGDIVAQTAPLSFDISIWQLLTSFLVGGRVHIVDGEVSRDPLRLLAEVERYAISVLEVVPSMLREMLGATRVQREAPGLSSLKIVIATGEALSPEVCQSWIKRYPRIPLLNAYGPTECSDDVTHYVIDELPATAVTGIPIGRPIANTRIYLLDGTLLPVPVGTAADLFVGGRGVGRGYIDNEAQTADVFVPDPFGKEPGARLYRTGDVGRHLPDGSIEFLGRIDHQVKIRGFRIELREIEAVLVSHPEVKEAVVVFQESGSGDKRLVGFFVPNPESAPAVLDLKNLLKSRLPEYMVPSALVVLEALPLTPNGKVDRRSLSDFEGLGAELTQSYMAARTPIEEVLTAIWSQVLGLDQVGIHDSFFDLGGHSLLVTQVISRIRDALNIELSLRIVFEAPTIAELAYNVEAEMRAEQGLLAPPILPVARDVDLPLSFAQARLWFIDQLGPGNPAYNIGAARRFRGPLAIGALEWSLHEIIRRHEALRVTFPTIRGQAVQIVTPSQDFRLPIVDISELPEERRESEMNRAAGEEATRPFDLARGPLLRSLLVKIGEQDHMLLVIMHHIVSDGWSTSIFLREMTTLYNAFCTGEQSPLASLPIQYVDFAVWQRNWLQGEILQTQLSYWQQQLGGKLPVLELPTDRPRPPVQTFAGAKQSIFIPRGLYDSLMELSKSEAVTLFMSLLAAFATLLYRYSGQDDIPIGTPVANRNRLEVEQLIGFFVNTLVLRTDMSGNPSFRRLLRQVREVTLGAYTHQDLPFERLVEAVEPERDLRLTPLFQVMFVLGAAAGEASGSLEASDSPGLRASWLPADTATAKFDLTLFISEQPAGLTAALEYNTDLFDAPGIARMLTNYQTLLESIVADPEQRLTRFPILGWAERNQLLSEWNEPENPRPPDCCIHRLLAAQSEKTPEAIALVDGEDQFSYSDLHARANKLANYLRREGVAAETLVGICIDRSAEMVVGMLGVLTAGGAYVPLDANQPTERLSLMLDDSKMKLLLTQERLIENLGEHCAKVINLGRDGEAIARESQSPPIGGTAGENLAYVIYTSGSTGGPKGVAINHDSVVTFLGWTLEAFERADFDGVLASTSICFDLSVFEIFAPLICGGTIILAGNALHMPTLPAANRIALVNTVPSAMAELLRIDGVPSSVRTVNLAGEPVLNSLVSQVYKLDGINGVFNLYGPSEDTTYSTYALLERESGQAPPIGHPIANTQIYMLDRQLELVPVGVQGELHIAGAGLARGYLDRPELTAEKFIPNPFARHQGARLYRTGDLARHLNDGTIDFQGRIDNQVKIRGYRIELGEIEEALREVAYVQDAVVQAWGGTTPESRLVAYIVPARERTIAAEELRGELSARLPEYMLPTHFVVLDGLPLTPNGKVDRRALAPPARTRPEIREVFAAPRDTLELKLLHVWEKVLGVSPIGTRDNFFALGGHSLMAVRLMAAIKDQFHQELPLATLFQRGTVERIADALRQRAPLEWSTLVPIQPNGSRRPFFCVHPAGGNVLAYYHLARYLGPDQPFFGLQAPDLKEISELGDNFDRLEDRATHYIEMMRLVQPEGPYLLGGWSFGGLMAFEMAHQLHREGQRVALLALFDSVAPIISFDDVDDTKTLVTLARELASQRGEELPLLANELAHLDPEDQLNYVLEKVKGIGIVSSDANPETTLLWMRSQLKGFRVRLQALRQYVPRVYAGQITLFRGDINPGHLKDDAMSAVVNLFKDEFHGWSGLSSTPVDVESVPGYHETLLSEPHVQTLADRLRARIENIEECN